VDEMRHSSLQSAASGHTHLQDVVLHADQLRCRRLILCGFSDAYVDY